MITKVFEVLDEWTRMFIMVVQFEEVDKDLCHKIGIAPGFKIINRLRGRVVDCFAGYEFDPNDFYYKPESQAKQFVSDGTINAFSILISYTEDIKKLPNTIDVDFVRDFWVKTSRGYFISDGIFETLEESDDHELRKCIYKWGNLNHLAIIDLDTEEVVYDVGSQDIERLITEYLWIPAKEATIEEIKPIQLSPFKYVLIKPSN